MNITGSAKGNGSERKSSTFSVLLCIILLHPFLGAASDANSPTGAITSAHDLILKTSTADLLCKNVDAVLLASASLNGRYDDAEFAEEFTRRFYWAEWPMESPLEDKQWARALPSAKLQAVCWLAECNKRMAVGDLGLRAKQREKLLTCVTEGLKGTHDPATIIGLLDVAFRTVFYKAPVVPRDGAGEVIDLFKEYLEYPNTEVHEFARDRLRCMGYVWRPRYQEILDFLLKKAPEIAPYLTAQPVQGMSIDILTGQDSAPGVVKEEDWLALLDMSPVALANIVEKTLPSERSQDICGKNAFGILVKRSLSKDDISAFETVRGLMRKGIGASNTLYKFAVHASGSLPKDEEDVARQRLEELISVLPEAANSTWADVPVQPEEVLRNSLSAVQQLKSKGDSAESTGSANMQVQQVLSTAIQKSVDQAKPTR
jgi:hypothetical protein